MAGEALPAKKQIAIIGGGVGAMTAAFALTDQPGWQDRYDITLYQMGWRLGGKGASGRNQDPKLGQRIEEHGLHIWFGFYYNSFAMMRTAFQDIKANGLAPGSPFQDWTDAFKPHSLVTVMEDFQGGWKPWNFTFPLNPEVPGEGGVLLKPWDYLRMLLDWITSQVSASPHLMAADAMVTVVEDIHTQFTSWMTSAFGRVTGGFQAIFERHTAVNPTPLTNAHLAKALADSMPSDPEQHLALEHHALLSFLKQFLDRTHPQIEDRLAGDDDLRRLWILIDTAAAVVRGMIVDGVLFHGFDCIDQYDIIEWLTRHGARYPDSCLIRGYYDLVFGFEKGDTANPNFAAGAAVRSILRILFLYKGAILYKMQAGMGDTIFGTLYLVLKSRGVKFRFFHRVTALGRSDDGRQVETIDFDIQATIKPDPKNPDGQYQPFVMVQGLPCWPSTPLYDQLVEGEALKRGNVDLESAWTDWKGKKLHLQRGTDFDHVVLGMSLAGLPSVCADLIAVQPRWQLMLQNVGTVRTQAFQVWLNRDSAGLGWDAKERAILDAYVEPLDTWADMSQLIDKEAWPAAANVQNISYFCGAMPDDANQPPAPEPAYPPTQEDLVKAQALQFLQKNIGVLWPKSTSAGDASALDWNLLVDLGNGQGAARFNSQFWRANIDPSERYVMSLKNTTQYRLTAANSGFANLFLVGDYTRNGINLGCVEAAALSGLQASRAMTGVPQQIPGENDNLDL